MKFIFPFAQHTGDKLGLTYVTLDIPSKEYCARRIRRLIVKVVKQKFGHTITKQEAHILFAAGKQITNPLGQALQNAEDFNIVLEQDELVDSVKQLQEAAERKLADKQA